ncbi:putative Actin cross-linking protein [Senna tora]|uniref:Putative Actin cross-linking protein n=1 Tax=Senna tora TaxID=362788 RepID=A0A834SSM4_9FABA|nr:putative Actin cross-linking protein [Senna tora]
MEFFTKTKAVKLRSHLDKYLVADDDREKVRQSRKGSSRKAKWMVELVEGKSQVVRLKSCHGRYLTASEIPFLLGMTGNRVVQADFEPGLDWKFEWEPIRDGFQVRLKSWCGKYLRGNGGTPPWRNSITQDEPHSSATQNWILWDVEATDLPAEDVDSFSGSVMSSSASDDILGSEPSSPMSVFSMNASPRQNSKLKVRQISSNKFRTGMDFFHNARAVRLRSHHDKYLLADEDEDAVTQDRNGSSKNARWVVEYVPDYDNIIRLKSCYGKYLTASNQPFLLGMTGRKVLQTLPRRLDSSVEWEPVREGSRVKLKTRYGNFLRANGGLPPWRNSVTHDIPHRTSTQDWILWDVDVVEIQVQSPGQRPAAPPVPHSDSLNFESTTPSAVSIKSANFSRQESTDSNVGSPPKMEGRTIYYHVAEDNGEVDDERVQGYSLIFKGNGVEELTRKFEEETGLEGVIVCTRSPLNGKLYPLRLQLPPNNVTMQVVLVLPSSKVARDFEEQGFL